MKEKRRKRDLKLSIKSKWLRDDPNFKPNLRMFGQQAQLVSP